MTLTLFDFGMTTNRKQYSWKCYGCLHANLANGKYSYMFDYEYVCYSCSHEGEE
jgi:hypothetical protein